MNRFRRSLDLAKASFNVIRQDRSLIVYPLVSAIAVAMLAALLAIPFYASGVFDSTDESSISIPQIIGLFVFYLLSYTIVFFCNSALVAEVMNRFDGNTTPISGWAFAMSRIGAIVAYAAIAATVGVALSVLSSKSGSVGRIAGAIGGAAWSILTFLVVPVLVVEKVGPIEALKRSASLLKRTWGEQLIGSGGIGLITGLATLVVGGIAAGLIALAAATGITALVVIAIVIGVLGVACVAVISAALDTIYRAAIYRYAMHEPIANYSATDSLPGAFNTR